MPDKLYHLSGINCLDIVKACIEHEFLFGINDNERRNFLKKKYFLTDSAIEFIVECADGIKKIGGGYNVSTGKWIGNKDWPKPKLEREDK